MITTTQEPTLPGRSGTGGATAAAALPTTSTRPLFDPILDSAPGMAPAVVALGDADVAAADGIPTGGRAGDAMLPVLSSSLFASGSGACSAGTTGTTGTTVPTGLAAATGFGTAPRPATSPAPAIGLRTHCPYCALQCGTVVTPEDPAFRTDPATALAAGTALRITGDESWPVNNGRLCVKGWTAGELPGHPERITRPLVRGQDGRLREATWPAALDALAERISAVRDSYGNEAMAVFGSGALTNEKAYLLGKFARVALRTPNIDYNGRWCMSSAAAAGMRAFGLDRGMPFPVGDIAGAEVVMLVGSNIADTLPPITQWFERQKAAGGRLIVVDPRLTPTAKMADLHLPIVPGGDLALAVGMLHVAWDEGLLDRDYIASRTVGFQEALRAALEYEPAKVEALSGISERQMRTAVRMLAKGGALGRTMILTGRGAEQQSKGVDTVSAFINLALALGKCGRPYSGYGCLTGQGNGQGGREHGQKADQLPGYRLIANPEHRRAVAAVWGVDPETLPGQGLSATELLRSLGPTGGIRGLLVMGSDVATAAPDNSVVEAGLESLDLLAVCDAFLSETARRAHFVLPVRQWAEEDGTMTNFEGRVLRRRAVMAPPSGVKADMEILCELAARLGCADKFASPDPATVFAEFRRATAGGPADYSGITWDRIDREQGVFWPCPAEDHPGTPRMFAERFAHADGKARFRPVKPRPSAEEPDARFPLRFSTGRLKEHYNSGVQTRLVGPLRKTRPEPVAQFHPMAAARYGIAEGDRVTLESRRGRVRFRVAVQADIRPDTVFVPFHWGGESAANRLTIAALDPISRMPEYKVCAVRVADTERAARPVAVEV